LRRMKSSASGLGSHSEGQLSGVPFRRTSLSGSWVRVAAYYAYEFFVAKNTGRAASPTLIHRDP
jgi:hypothetical protein